MLQVLLLLDCYTSHDRSWLRGTAAERRSLAGELTLFCARPVTDG